MRGIGRLEYGIWLWPLKIMNSAIAGTVSGTEWKCWSTGTQAGAQMKLQQAPVCSCVFETWPSLPNNHCLFIICIKFFQSIYIAINSAMAFDCIISVQYLHLTKQRKGCRTEEFSTWPSDCQEPWPMCTAVFWLPNIYIKACKEKSSWTRKSVRFKAALLLVNRKGGWGG